MDQTGEGEEKETNEFFRAARGKKTGQPTLEPKSESSGRVVAMQHRASSRRDIVARASPRPGLARFSALRLSPVLEPVPGYRV